MSKKRRKRNKRINIYNFTFNRINILSISNINMMDEKTIKELYELSLANAKITDNIIEWPKLWPFDNYRQWFITNSISDINETFKNIISSFYDLYLHIFDDNLRNKLKQLLDSDDVANHHIAFRLIYQQFKNT